MKSFGSRLTAQIQEIALLWFFFSFEEATTNNEALNVTFKTHATTYLHTNPLGEKPIIVEGCLM